MKTYPLLIFSLGLTLFASCESKSKTEIKDILPQSEIVDNDTVNRIDIHGLKQGRWIVYEVGPENINISVTHSADSAQTNPSWQSSSGRTKVEEGHYKDDKKTGYWKTFTVKGLKDSVEFK